MVLFNYSVVLPAPVMISAQVLSLVIFAAYPKMMTQQKRGRLFDPEQLVLMLAALALLLFSIRFAAERVIFTDTAVYLYTVADSGKVYIATNRFICLISQVLPLLGIAAGFSLKTVIYLYSVNCILIPLLSSWICVRVFRNRSIAVAILLFYVLMNAWVFYYPVTEFQMGLCLLLLYHAFVLWYLEHKQSRTRVFMLVSLLLVPTIIFSHPLALYVFIAWSVWLFHMHPLSRKRLLLMPPLLAIAVHFIKEFFFKSMVGAADYEAQRKEGLVNFKAPLATYFDSLLGKGALKALTGDYFVMLALVALLLFCYVKRKQWLHLLLFAGTILSFWLLVTVAFRDWPYDHYPEHLYQPVPFFVALAFATLLPSLTGKAVVRASLLLVIFAISLGKIYDNHKFYTGRLDWYRRYIQLMRQSGIRNATLSETHKIYGIRYSYWASNCESMLLSALPGPDSAVRILVDGNAVLLNKNPAAYTSGNAAYFGNIREPFISLDSLYSPRLLDSVAQAPARH
jgi:hypothetical protein